MPRDPRVLLFVGIAAGLAVGYALRSMRCECHDQGSSSS